MTLNSRRTTDLHLATLGNHNVHVGHILAFVTGFGGFDFLDHVHAIDDFTKDDVLAIKERRRDRGDEELAAIGVGARILKMKCQTRKREKV